MAGGFCVLKKSVMADSKRLPEAPLGRRSCDRPVILK
nr:MAG TPA: hypothetical protein [Caudoviricetes sp.]